MCLSLLSPCTYLPLMTSHSPTASLVKYVAGLNLETLSCGGCKTWESSTTVGSFQKLRWWHGTSSHVFCRSHGTNWWGWALFCAIRWCKLAKPGKWRYRSWRHRLWNPRKYPEEMSLEQPLCQRLSLLMRCRTLRLGPEVNRKREGHDPGDDAINQEVAAGGSIQCQRLSHSVRYRTLRLGPNMNLNRIMKKVAAGETSPVSEAFTTSEVQDTEKGSREEPEVEPGQRDLVMTEQEHQKNVSEQVKGLNSNFVEQLLPVEVREQQLNDPELYPVACFLEGAQPSEAQLQDLILNTSHLRLCRSQLEMVKNCITVSVGGCQWYQETYGCPKESEAINSIEFHDHKTSGHLGRDKNLIKIRHQFYRYGIRCDVLIFLNMCAACSLSKRSAVASPNSSQRLDAQMGSSWHPKKASGGTTRLCRWL